MRTHLALFLLSAATLTFEINLTRLFSVAQFYHFAFMIVSLALLGFGASGSALALAPHWGRRHPDRALARLSLGFALSSLGGYLLTNHIPFDSFSIAWDRRQAGVLALHYLALAAPFFCSGAAVGLLLAARPRQAARTYFVNLSGSAAGCRAAQVDEIGAGGLTGAGGQEQAHSGPAAEKGCCQGQVVQGQHACLSPVPGDAERVEGDVVGQEVAAQAAQGEPQGEAGQGAVGVTAAPVGSQRQRRSAGPKPQQRQADDHEGKVIELGHREQPGQVDLKGQRRCREEEQGQVGAHTLIVLCPGWIGKCYGGFATVHFS